MNPLGSFWLGLARVLAATIFDDGHGVPAERLDWLVAEYADFTRAVGAKTRLGFRGALLLLQLLPLFVVGVPLPMTWLSPSRRHRYLEKMEASALFTVLVTATKMPMALIYFEHPEVMATTGYDGRPMRPLPGEDAPGAMPATATKARLSVLPPEGLPVRREER